MILEEPVKQNALDLSLGSYLPPRYANAFKRSGRNTPRDLIKDIEDHGVQQFHKGGTVVYTVDEWSCMRNVGNMCVAAALELLSTLGFDWESRSRKRSFIETAINNEIKSVQRLYSMLVFYMMIRGGEMLKAEEIRLILRLVEKGHELGYAEDEEVAKLQAKLSMMLEAASG